MKLGYITDGKYPDYYAYEPVSVLMSQREKRDFDLYQDEIMFAQWEVTKYWT